MKNKKLWGILGLIIVAALTVAAYFTPSANAESGQTTITVNVTNPKQPAVEITEPASGAEVINDGGVTLGFDYEETDEIIISITCGESGGAGEFITPTTDTGSFSRKVSIPEPNYYGPVTISVRGNAEGSEDIKTVTFNLVPATAEAADPEDNGDPNIDIETDPNVDKVIISVVDPETGEKVMDDVEVPADDLDDSVALPFEDNDLADGNYKIIITSYNDNGDQLGEPKVINYSYEKKSAPIVPDTGSFSEHLNVSKTDYLIVGLAAAGFAVLALGFLLIKRSRR